MPQRAPLKLVTVPQERAPLKLITVADEPAAPATESSVPSPEAAAASGFLQGPIDALKAVTQIYKVPMTMTKNVNALNGAMGMPSTGITFNPASAEENAQAANASGALLNLVSSAGFIAKAPAAAAAIRSAITSPMGKAVAREAVKHVLKGAGAGAAYEILRKYMN